MGPLRPPLLPDLCFVFFLRRPQTLPGRPPDEHLALGVASSIVSVHRSCLRFRVSQPGVLVAYRAGLGFYRQTSVSAETAYCHG
jgi:hypothetical protein